MEKVVKVTVLTGVLLSIWSALFASTFRYPFFWDDYHLIRSYSGAEIRSAFHAEPDPDKIETPGLRPCSIFLFDFQGSSFGDNVVAHHAFMVALMGIFMIAAGMLLLEVGLHFYQVIIVLALFVSSRIFASLVLWISLSHLLLAYLCIVLTAYFFVLWTRKGHWFWFLLMSVACTLATFTREETYTLPVVLPILWLISFFDRTQWRRVAIAALSLFAIVSFHYVLWHLLVPNALSPRFNFGAVKRLLTAISGSWLPRGVKMVGSVDTLFGAFWIIFVVGLVSIFLKLARPRVRWQFLGACCLGVLLCLPALGIGRPFGIALPTLAFMTAISIAVGEVSTQIQAGTGFREWQRTAVTAGIILGLATGIGGGIRRSFDVAEFLRPNCAVRIVRDGEYLFDQLDHAVTIPEQRRKAGLARLESLGISSAADLSRMKSDVQNGSFRQNRETENGVFLPKYDYLSF
ncbi:MAG TPA: hypothetical protein VNX27_08995 [Chthoniobacterales bacterium]|jgi:hypothetical protein|nr:hypothetical protein [Chthoniobacterales bacterium]